MKTVVQEISRDIIICYHPFPVITDRDFVFKPGTDPGERIIKHYPKLDYVRVYEENSNVFIDFSANEFRRIVATVDLLQLPEDEIYQFRD